MLPNSARIKSSSDFARVTKSGRRFTSDSFIAYLYASEETTSTSNTTNPKLGLIVGKSIGNSVLRHRISRQIRHAVKAKLNLLPTGSMLVIRAMKRPANAFNEANELISKITKSLVKA